MKDVTRNLQKELRKRRELLECLDEDASANPRSIQRWVREELPQMEGGPAAGRRRCGSELLGLAQALLNGKPPPARTAAEEARTTNGVAGLAEGNDLGVAATRAESSDSRGHTVT